MAEAGNWRTWFAAGVLWLGACGSVRAQTVLTDPAPMHGIEIQAPPSGSLAGRLTNLQSAPLAGVSVILRNQATGAEVRLVTGKNGGFRLARLQAGEYTLEADEPQLGHGRLEGILVTGGMEARVQAALRFEPAAPEIRPTELAEAAAAPSGIAVPPRTAATMPLMARETPGASRPAESTFAPSLAVTPGAASSQGLAPAQTQNAPISSAPVSRVSAAAPASPPVTVSRATFSTANPEIIAMVGPQPLRTMHSTPRDAEAVHPPRGLAAPQPVAPMFVAPQRQLLQPVKSQPAATDAEEWSAPPAVPSPHD
jgi:hypothetical protein